MEKKTMRRRYASFVALTAMVLSAMVPMTAFADDDGEEAPVFFAVGQVGCKMAVDLERVHRQIL